MSEIISIAPGLATVASFVSPAAGWGSRVLTVRTVRHVELGLSVVAVTAVSVPGAVTGVRQAELERVA